MAINPTTKPHSLTHISNLSWDDDNQLIVHEIVGVDPNGVVRKVPVTVDGKLDVNATVTATIDPTGLASDTNQTSGYQKTQIVDAAGDNYDALNPLPVSASIDTTGLATDTKQDTQTALLGGIAGLLPTAFDYISQAQDTLTDTWTFKTGGAGGTTVSTITITYTDATKAVISTVVKT